jgi:hypothetical protein
VVNGSFAAVAVGQRGRSSDGKRPATAVLSDQMSGGKVRKAEVQIQKVLTLRSLHG